MLLAVGVTKVNPAWLPSLGRPLCIFSKPVEGPASTLASRTKSISADTREIFVIPRFGTGMGIELKPILVTQKLIGGRWIFI